MVIEDRTVVQATVLKPHLAPKRQAAADYLYACRQEPVVPTQTHTDMQNLPNA